MIIDPHACGQLSSNSPRAYPLPRIIILFISGTLLLSAAILSGCAGVTSAKGSSTTSTTNTTNSTNSTSSSTQTSPAALSASPGSVSFGNVAVGSTANQSLTVTNSGGATLTISQAVASGAGFTLSGVPLPVSLNPGNSATFTASFTPAATGNTSGAATFTSADLGAPVSIALTGTGVGVAPAIAVQPISISILSGQTATFSVAATGTAPLSYQWKLNGAAISGATSSTYTTPAETTSNNGAQFTVSVSNSAGSIISNAAILTVTTAPVAPTITSQPVNQTIFAGQTATFSIIANGTSPLSYQWRKNGAAISGATASSYTTPAETTSDNGALFSVLVTNSAGSATSSSATLTVNPDPVAPTITTQPASQTITAGQTATFSVVASGTSPLSYQWRKNGAAINGATSASYITPAETTADNGAQFTVTVSNSAGSVTSNTAILTVNPAPVAPSITTQPASQTIASGQTATFSVTATGTAPLSYQWRKNGTAIGGASSASYTTPSETTADNGALFSVVVSNSAGSATSSNATLTVTSSTGALNPSTTSLGFNSVNVGSNSSLPVTFTNAGSTNITISNVSVSGAGFSASGISNGQVIGGGQTATLNVTFAPSSSGTLNGSVTVTSNASNPTITITLSGTGVQVSHSAALSWTASTSSGVNGYNVFRGIVSGGPYTQLNSSLVSGTSYTDSSVTAGTTYYYVVTAVASGVQSADSNQATAVIP
jgi:invasion protein IalB